jgi:hypothetical protein
MLPPVLMWMIFKPSATFSNLTVLKVIVSMHEFSCFVLNGVMTFNYRADSFFSLDMVLEGLYSSFHRSSDQRREGVASIDWPRATPVRKGLAVVRRTAQDCRNWGGNQSRSCSRSMSPLPVGQHNRSPSLRGKTTAYSLSGLWFLTRRTTCAAQDV